MLVERLVLGVVLWAAGTRAATASEDSFVTSTPDASMTASSTSTAYDGPQTHEVNVGLPIHQFGPDEIEANPGDTVRFVFYPPNHSVIRAAFGYPCIPWEYVNADGDPFYSGIRKVTTADETNTFEIVVNDTAPIFYYCGAPGSCLDEGMLGVINPNKSQTLKMQKDARDDFDMVLVPGDPWPEEGNPMATVSDLAITQTQTGGPTATATSNSDDGNDEKHNSLNPAQIAGIAIGGAALLVIVGALIYFCGRRGGLEKGYRKSGYMGPQLGGQGAQAQMADNTFSAESPNMSKHVPSGVSSVHYGLGMNNAASPPMSPGMASMQSGTMHSAQYVPGMMSPYQYQGQLSPQPTAEIQQSAAPVELPTSGDPGNSPLPQYSNQAGNTYSWAPREESGYRPGDKS